jgi:hypothetical protein
MRRIPATRDCARALLDIAPERQRAECRVLAAPMARQQTKKLAAVTTGSAKSAGIPCAMVLTVSFVLSRGPGFIASVIARFVTAQLGASVGAPGPHDFAVRVGIVRPRTQGTRAIASTASPLHVS